MKLQKDNPQKGKTKDGEDEQKVKYNNDIRDIRSVKQLDKLMLDFDSPRLKQAMDDLGVAREECEMKDRVAFEKKGLPPDVIDLRFKHYLARLMDTINRIVEQRRQIKQDQMRQQNRQNSVSINSQAQYNSPPSRQLHEKMSRTQAIDKSKTSVVNDYQSSFFLTGIAEQPQAVQSVGRTPKITVQLNNLVASQRTTPRNFNDVSMMSYGHRSQMPFEQLAESARRKADQDHARSRSLILMYQIDKKHRLSLEKQIEQKLQKAEKKQVKELKSRTQNAKNHLSIVEQKLQQKLQDDRANLNDTLSAIKELREKDQADQEKLKQRRQQKMSLIEQYNKAKNQKKERVKMYQEAENNRLDLYPQQFFENYERKVQTVNMQRNIQLEQIKGRVSARNAMSNQKFLSARESSKERNDLLQIQFEKTEHEKEKQLRRIYKEVHSLWSDFKKQKQATADLMQEKKQNDEYTRKERAQEMMAKLQRSQKAVESYMKDQAHKNMLQQEQRKLHDEDMKKVHERAKRLATRKKMEILGKEQNDKKLVEEVKRREQQLVGLRFKNRLQNIQNVEKDQKALNDWARGGFTQASLAKDYVDIVHTMNSKHTKKESKNAESKTDHPQI